MLPLTPFPITRSLTDALDVTTPKVEGRCLAGRVRARKTCGTLLLPALGSNQEPPD